MSAPNASAGAPVGAPRSPTVFFLTDYGLSDEFVGVVHAVIRRDTPSAVVVDLTHGIPPFDVRAGSEALLRAVPHLGPGVVLAVVDPGVGGARRGVAVEAEGPPRRWFVAPDNGLVVAAAEWSGGIRSVWELLKPPEAPATFDGRDVFAPAAAALAAGADPASLGDPADPAGLHRLGSPLLEAGGDRDRPWLRAEVTWVDRFGNVQLAATPLVVPIEVGTEPVSVRVARSAEPAGAGGEGASLRARRVRTFGDLEPGQLGVLVDANDHLSLAVREGSAQEATGARPGDVVELTW